MTCIGQICLCKTQLIPKSYHRAVVLRVALDLWSIVLFFRRKPLLLISRGIHPKVNLTRAALLEAQRGRDESVSCSGLGEFVSWS